MATSAPSGDRQTRAILLMVLGVGTLSVNDAIIKWLSGDLAVGQILCLRGLIVVAVYGGVIGLSQGFHVFRMARPKVHLTRGLFLLASAYTFVTGLSLLPLADAFALSFAGPLFMVVLAILFLGERVGWRRWAAVVIGFLAVLVMVQPGTSAFQLAALFPLAAAFAGRPRRHHPAHGARGKHPRDSALGTAIVAVGGLASLPWGWGPVTLADGGCCGHRHPAMPGPLLDDRILPLWRDQLVGAVQIHRPGVGDRHRLPGLGHFPRQPYPDWRGGDQRQRDLHRPARGARPLTL